MFKLVTYSSALEKHLFKPTDMIDAGNGTIEVADHKFSDSITSAGHVCRGACPFEQRLRDQDGMRVGKADFCAMVKKMGFGSRTGVELPAETAGIVRSPDKWNGDSLASMSIGYEIGVTRVANGNCFCDDSKRRNSKSSRTSSRKFGTQTGENGFALTNQIKPR